MQGENPSSDSHPTQLGHRSISKHANADALRIARADTSRRSRPGLDARHVPKDRTA